MIRFPQGRYRTPECPPRSSLAFSLLLLHSIKVEVRHACSCSSPRRQNLSNALRIWHVHLPPTQEGLMGQRAHACKDDKRERENSPEHKPPGDWQYSTCICDDDRVCVCACGCIAERKGHVADLRALACSTKVFSAKSRKKIGQNTGWLPWL